MKRTSWTPDEDLTAAQRRALHPTVAQRFHIHVQQQQKTNLRRIADSNRSVLSGQLSCADVSSRSCFPVQSSPISATLDKVKNGAFAVWHFSTDMKPVAVPMAIMRAEKVSMKCKVNEASKEEEAGRKTVRRWATVSNSNSCSRSDGVRSWADGDDDEIGQIFTIRAVRSLNNHCG
ncbi:Saccharopine dehydrogenase [Anopheles sinensis]|uniref:Saccharopine dehydrogenase n=1 Tax=Anopheles sinensis TaxID=74873 RepID=A0A084VZZ8_ANOSI|nr:Saccharopine dehydrogenase [Anopheles sinensis]